MKKTRFEVGACGRACEVCRWLNKGCLGCKRENTKLKANCIIFKCAKKRKVSSCLKCKKMPCCAGC